MNATIAIRRRERELAPVSIGLLPIYSIDPSQHNDTSVRSSVRTTEGLDSHGSGSSQTPECIPGRSEHLPVPRGVEDKCGDNILCDYAEPYIDDKTRCLHMGFVIDIWRVNHMSKKAA